MKSKTGQIQTVGDYYAKVDPHVWKQLKEEEEEETGLHATVTSDCDTPIRM
jgi:hypothetical protein